MNTPLPSHFSSRRAILEAEGLTVAPARVQEVFWQHHNRSRRTNRRPAVKLGDMISTLMSDRTLQSPDRLRQVEQAWHCVVPPAQRGHTRVVSLHRGKLSIAVDNKSTGYVLRRQLYGRLMSRLNERLDGIVVSTIDFRVGPLSP